MKTFTFAKQSAHGLMGALMCALVATTTGCSKEENTFDGIGKRITATATTPPDGIHTRAIYKSNGNKEELFWEKNDVIGVWKAGETKVNPFSLAGDVESTGTKSGKFEGVIDGCQDGDQLYAVYPASAEVEQGDRITFDLSKQTGGYLDLSHIHMFASGIQKDNMVGFKFQYAVAILQLKFFWAEDEWKPEGIKSLTLSANGLCNKAILSMNGNGSSGLDLTSKGDIVMGVGEPNFFSFCLFAGNLSGVKIQVVGSNDSHYEGTLNDKYVEEGHFYEADVLMKLVN